MKLLIRFGNGPTRSLSRLVGAVLAAIVAVGFFCLTDWAIDTEIAYHDAIISEYICK